LRRAARRNSAVFGAVYRGINPGPQQYEMAARCDNDRLKYQADFWPRDHGKTEIFVNDLPLRTICENPDSRILIVQKTATEARKAISVIKTELEQNTLLRQGYAAHWQKVVGVPDIVNKAGMVDDKTGAWQTQRIYVKRRRVSKDPTLEAVGVGGAITGGHYDLIICDDILDDENTKTADRSQKIINWFFGTILQLREPHTKIIVVGTLKTLMENLYSVLLENQMWDTTVRSAILSHDIDEIEYRPVYETSSEGQRQVVGVEVQTAGVQTMWPAVWPIEALLLDMLGSPRRIWRREKLNDLQAMAEQIFKRRMFKYFELTSPPRFRRVVQSWDTAFKKTGDYSALTEWGEANAGAFLLSAWREKLEWPELAIAIPLFYLLSDWPVQAVLIEDKASGQSAIQEWGRGKDREAWLVELRQYIEQPAANRRLVQMARQALSMPGLPQTIRVPVQAVKVGGEKDKTARAEDASVWWSNGQVYHYQSADRKMQTIREQFEAELISFPDVTNDDWADSAVQAVQHLLAAGRAHSSGKL